jgi:hypothetical protein
MLRRAVARHHHIQDIRLADSVTAKIPLLRKTCRLLLRMGVYILALDTRLDVLSQAFRALGGHVPYAFVAQEILDSDDPAGMVEEETMLREIMQHVERGAREEAEAESLAIALRRMVEEIQDKMGLARSV